MSEDHEFALIAQALRNDGLGGRNFLAERLRRGVWILAAALSLLALAVLLALTNTISVVITLAVVGIVLHQLVLIGIREHRREAV